MASVCGTQDLLRWSMITVSRVLDISVQHDGGQAAMRIGEPFYQTTLTDKPERVL